MLTKIRDFIRDVIKHVGNYFSSDDAKRWQKAQAMWEEAVNKAEAAEATGDVEYKINENKQEFRKKFSKDVKGTIPLSKSEKSAIISKIMTNEFGVDESSEYGYVRSYENEYRFFINPDNSVTVYDVVDNEELNIHDNKYEKGYENVRNRRFGGNVSEKRNIQRNGTGVFSNGTETGKQEKTNDMDGGKSAGDTTRDISEDKSNNIKTGLEKQNIPIVEYANGDKESRLNALNSLDELRFKLQEPTEMEKALVEENAELKRQVEELQKRAVTAEKRLETVKTPQVVEKHASSEQAQNALFSEEEQQPVSCRLK